MRAMPLTGGDGALGAAYERVPADDKKYTAPAGAAIIGGMRPTTAVISVKSPMPSPATMASIAFGGVD